MCWQQLLAVVRDMNICASLQKTRGSKLRGRNCVKLFTPIRGAEPLLRADLYKEAVSSILGCWVFVVVFNFFSFFLIMTACSSKLEFPAVNYIRLLASHVHTLLLDWKEEQKMPS